MLISPGLAMLFLLRSSTAEECPEKCKCISSFESVAINCSFRGLREIPSIPETATELYLRDNLLTTVAPGTFDKLPNLRTISLHNNPWGCDCHIAYLHQWLQHPSAAVQPNVICFTPAAIRMKPVSELRGNEYSACRSRNLYPCRNMYAGSIILCPLCLLLLVLMACSCTNIKSKAYTFTPNNDVSINKHFKMRQRKRERRNLLTDFELIIEWPGDDLEKPFFCESMERHGGAAKQPDLLSISSSFCSDFRFQTSARQDGAAAGRGPGPRFRVVSSGPVGGGGGFCARHARGRLWALALRPLVHRPGTGIGTGPRR
ncbi:platelet glycoprotein IX [Rhinoraja longicauda]